MKSTHSRMGLAAAAFHTMRTQKHSPRPLRKGFRPGPVIIERPVWRVGDFYGKLDDEAKKRARSLARWASHLPRCKIETAVRQLQRESETTNYTGVR